jgi:RNA polymerase subunit RPABC4/transcription elongation factor Spt4
MQCPKCNTELENGKMNCPICGWESTEKQEWVVLGTIEARPFADLARETLKSLDIPAVVVSRAGFFGNIGLPLNSVFDSGKLGIFEIRVHQSFINEAADALDMTLGDKWQRENT